MADIINIKVSKANVREIVSYLKITKKIAEEFGSEPDCVRLNTLIVWLQTKC